MAASRNPGADREAFLTAHGLRVADFAASGLNWEDLDRIEADHSQRSQQLEDVADFFANMLQRVPAVHSVRVRVKDPAHLIAKIIRKRIEQPTRVIGSENYRMEITDLIGIRALHLFKDQWRPIHDFLKEKCNEHESPVAYYREGDPTELLDEFAAAQCRIEVHEAGYRTVHYVIASTPTKDTHLIEVQVRTVFEEGWAEVDHLVRYPSKTNDKVLASFLRLFNQLCRNR